MAYADQLAEGPAYTVQTTALQTGNCMRASPGLFQLHFDRWSVRGRGAKIGVLASLALFAISCSSSKCFVDCAFGYEAAPNSCSCRLIADASVDGADRVDSAGQSDAVPDGAALASCAPGSSCGTGSTCIAACPVPQDAAGGATGGICSVPGRDSCGCGIIADPCGSPGTLCLMPACCDYSGVCVTPTERAAICARPEGVHFDCSGIDAGT